MSKSSRNMFVYGALRSGSTLLRLMLDGHPRLSCPGESDFMFDYVSVRGGVRVLDLDALQRDWIFAGLGFDLPGGSAEAAVFSLADQVRMQCDIGVMVLHRGIDRALDFFGDARIIHLVRDPRDVARSSVPMGWAGNAYCGVDHWIRTEEAWTAVQDRLQPGQVLEVRYEDLVRSPEAVLTRICDFAGIGYDAAMMGYDQRSSYARPDPEKAEQWRKRLTPREVAQLEAKLGARLFAHGYRASGHPPVSPGAFADIALRLQSKHKVWSRKFGDYGVVDPIMVTVAHRMRLPDLASGAKKRIESKMIAGLK